MSAATVSAAAVVAATAALAALYWRLVPPDDLDLGGLDAAASKGQGYVPVAPADDKAAYPATLFGERLTANLPLGKTHYFMVGPRDGKRVVLVHGITISWAAFPSFVHDLSSKGYLVLGFDLYGRGFSASPGVAYTPSVYVNQLNGLLDHVGWDKANVVGYSLGGGVVTAFAAQYPQRVEKLVLLAPAGLQESIPSAAVALLSLPFIGRLFSHTIGRRLLSHLSAKNVKPTSSSALTPALQADIDHFCRVMRLNVLHNPGFMRAYRSSLLVGPVSKMKPAYKTVESNGVGKRTLCVWGTADLVVSFRRDSPVFHQVVPSAKLVEIPEAGHSIVLLDRTAVIKAINEFL
ncbi:Alpha/Beta hydrolase protein [Zopfochytrium polystomum]|nr:Alpha/Beta hydrolase protein [Zopfochytrium polystomum]